MVRSARLAAIAAGAVALVAAASAPAFASGTADITFLGCTFTAQTTGGPPPTSMTVTASGTSATSCGPGITATIDSDITYTFNPTATTATESSFSFTQTLTENGTTTVCHYTTLVTELALVSAGPPTWRYSGAIAPALDRDTSSGSCPINPTSSITVSLTPVS